MESTHWKTNTLPPVNTWYIRYPESLLDSPQYESAIRLVRNNPAANVDSVLLDKIDVEALTENVKPIKDKLEKETGFVIIEGDYLFEKYTHKEVSLLYYLIGQLLGKPLFQNTQDVLLYDVKDQKKDLGEGARFSVTNYESGFHTDNCFGNEVVDYVGLLCYHPAKSGGESQIVSALTVFDELKGKYPAEFSISNLVFLSC